MSADLRAGYLAALDRAASTAIAAAGDWHAMMQTAALRDRKDADYLWHAASDLLTAVKLLQSRQH